MACDFNELLLNWKLNKIDIKATNNDGLTSLDILYQYCLFPCQIKMNFYPLKM